MDPISDMLTSIRNALAVGKETVDIPFSNLKYEIAKIFEKEGFIEKVEKKGRKNKKILEIKLKYENKIPLISSLKIISKPGQRIYLPAKKIRLSNKTLVISTSKGLMTNKEARRQKLGGEVLCEIW